MRVPMSWFARLDKEPSTTPAPAAPADLRRGEQVVVCWSSEKTGKPKSVEGVVAYAGESRVQVRWEYSVLIEGELVPRTKLRWFPRSQVRRVGDAEQGKKGKGA
jgi:hypothetical protein